MNKEAAQKMARAKASLILENAFFASIICTMPMIEDETINPPTMATNAEWVRYHPDFVNSLKHDEVKFVLCHEVGHCIFQHAFRRGGRDHRKWNQAGDYVINNMLVDSKVGIMPEMGLHNPVLVAAGGGTTDGVYNLLPDAQDDGSGNPSNGHGAPMDDCQDHGGSPAEAAEAEAKMKVKISQAAAAAKACGQMTDAIRRLVDEALKPNLDWEDIMRRFVSTRAKVERTWARPNRRFMSQGLYMPSMGGETLGGVLVAIDHSGSVSQREANAFFANLKSIHEDVKPVSTDVLYFHSHVCHHDHFEQDDEIHPSETESGGTRFSPIFAYAEAHGIEPDCCIVITDLECYDFGPPPPYPVLWVTTHLEKAPWGEVVKMVLADK